MRKLPLLTAETRAFWTGGAAGELMINRCGDCGRYFHPPNPACRACASRNVSPTAVSGRGRVLAFSINLQPWTPELAEPFVVAIIELDEQPGLRLMSNVIGCPPDAVEIGMPVKVAFEHIDDVWIPLFEAAA